MTFSGNEAGYSGGGGMRNYDSSPTLANSILWANTDSGADIQRAQIYNSNSTIAVTYSLVGGGVYTGTGNIDANPLFVDCDGPDGIPGTPDDDLRLQLTSPAIDAGDKSAVPTDILDLDGDGAEMLPYDLDGCARCVDIRSDPTPA